MAECKHPFVRVSNGKDYCRYCGAEVKPQNVMDKYAAAIISLGSLAMPS